MKNLPADENPKPVENELLLRLAHDGDREALGALLKLYRRQMLLLARGQIDPWVQVKVDASDLAQEACLEAHRHFGQFRGATDAEFGSWMRKILGGLVANSVRRYSGTKRRDLRRERPFATNRLESSAVYASEAIARDGTPSELAVKNETSSRLKLAMDQLAPHYRQVIELRSIQGMSFAEIADRMGRSVDSVEKLWLRAVSKLRALLHYSAHR